MIRHWILHSEPVISLVRPTRLMEVGADAGWNTARLLDWCRRSGAILDVIDPEPKPSLHKVLAKYPREHVYHALPSLKGMPAAEHPQLLLIDGDHNWSTVYSELMLMQALSLERGLPFPVVLFHDCAWPYARRDMYYVPDRVEAKHPYAYVGLAPGNPGVVENGMNHTLANALRESGPRNGVLTAIEDFIAQAPFQARLDVMPFFNGLGILTPQDSLTQPLRDLLDSFYGGEHLMKVAKALEEDGMKQRVRVAQMEVELAERTDALKKARDLLATRDANGA